MKLPPDQLEIDFSIPVDDPLTVGQIARAMKLSTGKIFAAIERGDLQAVCNHRQSADREHYVVPLRNYIAWLNNEYPDELYFRFPPHDQISVQRVAQAMACSDQHIYNLIDDKEFPNARNQGRPGCRSHWIIPLTDLVKYINRNRVGAYS